MKRTFLIVPLIVMSLFPITGCGGHKTHKSAHWGYTGSEGPEHWGTLDDSFIACATGKNQSPIDLTGFIEAELEPLKVDCQTGGFEILNNGHTVQVNFEPGSTLTIDGMTFALKQFHFHTPSENMIDAKSFPMEAHLVHADSAGNLAVVAVMYESGTANPTIASLWKHLPKAGHTVALKEKVSATGIMPKNLDYYRFNGSLTTPPCTEGVRWLVLKTPSTVSKDQVDAFAKLMGHPNNRPVQPTNARPVLK